MHVVVGVLAAAAQPQVLELVADNRVDGELAVAELGEADASRTSGRGPPIGQHQAPNSCFSTTEPDQEPPTTSDDAARNGKAGQGRGPYGGAPTDTLAHGRVDANIRIPKSSGVSAIWIIPRPGSMRDNRLRVRCKFG